MLQWQAKRFLDASRSELGRSEIALGRIRMRAPGLADFLLNNHLGLIARQEHLEKQYANNGNGNLGELGFIWWIPVLAVSAAGGLGAWLYKHFQDTGLERKKLECCDNLIKNGYKAEDALKICTGVAAKPSIFSDLTSFLKLATGVSVVALIAYLFLYRKRRR